MCHQNQESWFALGCKPSKILALHSPAIHPRREDATIFDILQQTPSQAGCGTSI
jgi:hypothetical protein